MGTAKRSYAFSQSCPKRLLIGVLSFACHVFGQSWDVARKVLRALLALPVQVFLGDLIL